MKTEQWHEKRRKGIGGSDVAPILGISPWRTPYEVWEEKLSLRESQETTPEMQYGLMMEPVIRQWYSNETGLSVRVPKEIIVHPEFDFIVANVDGLTDNERVLEIKTSRSSKGWGEPGTDEIPEYYRTQVEHYMIVTGYVLADVVVSISGSMPVIYTVEADSELQDIILEKEKEFWTLVETRTPPEHLTYSDLISKFQKSRAQTVLADSDCLAAIMQLKELNEFLKREQEQVEHLKSIIMTTLGENDTLVDADGRVLATWKQSKERESFDSKLFQKDHPELFTEYLKTGKASRRFLLK